MSKQNKSEENYGFVIVIAGLAFLSFMMNIFPHFTQALFSISIVTGLLFGFIYFGPRGGYSTPTTRSNAHLYNHRGRPIRRNRR